MRDKVMRQNRNLSSPRRRRLQSGHVMVEMGLCMSGLFFMIFGIEEYSRLAYANNFCGYAAQMAARYAAVHGAASVSPLPTSPSPCETSCTNTSSDATTTYVKGLAIALDTTKLTVSTAWSSSTGNGNAAGGIVTVTVKYDYNSMFQSITALPSTFNATSSSTMTVLQ